MRSFLFVVVALTLVAPDGIQAQRPDLLAGLDSIRVAVEPLSPTGQNAGLSQESLKTAVEMRLRETGIPVSQDGTSLLYVDLNVIAMADSDGYAFSQRLTLNEMVFLVRHATDVYVDYSPVDQPRTLGDFVLNQPRLVASTWETVGRTGTTPPDNAAKFIVDRVLEDVNAFASDFLDGNPQ